MSRHTKQSGDRDARSAGQTGVSKRNRRMALEPRVLLDAAAVETVLDVADVPAQDTTTTEQSLFQATDPSKEVYFIDSRVEDIASLLDSIPSGAEIFILSPESSGLEQMNELLAGTTGLNAIHLISHGDTGRFAAGSDLISSENLDSFTGQLSAIGGALSDTGDLLIYGCNVGSDEAGTQFLERLSSLTGADVAASDDITGFSGDWDLESVVGSLEAQAISPEGYQGTLNLDGIKFHTEYGAAPDTELGWSVAADGDWVVAGSNGDGYVATFYVQGETVTRQNITRPNTTFWTTQFGRGVTISGDTLVVADPSAGASGAIAIYKLDGNNNWVFTNSVDFGARTGQTNDSRIGGYLNGYGENQFLDVDGNHILVGAPNEGSGTGQGRVFWVASSSGTDWTGTLSVGYFDEPESGADGNGSFGASVAIAKDYFIVSNPTLDTNGDDGYNGGGNESNHGRVYIYEWNEGSSSGPSTTPFSGSGWSSLNGQADADGSLNGGSSGTNHYFGSAIDMEFANGRYTIAAGAPNEGTGGEVYIYQTDNSAMNTLKAPMNIYGLSGIGAGDKFGASVRVGGAKVILGAPGQTDANLASVFYIEDIDGTWATGNTNNPAGTNILSYTAAQLGFGGGQRAGWASGFAKGNMIVTSAPSWNSNTGGIAFLYMRTPVAVNDSWTVSEDIGSANYDILANDVLGTENTGSIGFAITGQEGLGSVSWNGSILTYNPGNGYQYLAAGESETVRITYRLTDLSNPSWTSFATITFTINGVNDAVGDGIGLSDVVVPQANEPPGATSPSSPSTGSIAIDENVFSDVDLSNDLTYTIAGVTTVSGTVANIGSHLTINGNTGFRTGTIGYNLTGVAENTVWDITIRASDGVTTRDTVFRFTVARANETPESSPVPNQGAVEDTVFSVDLGSYFTDPDFAPVDPFYPEELTFSISSQTGPGPDWLAISANGVLSGVANNDNALSGGVHTVTVRATDIFGNYTEQTFDVTVANTNDAPVLTQSIDRVVAEAGSGASPFSFNVTAANAENPDGPFFQDIDPTGDSVTYTAYLLTSGAEITAGSAGTGTGSWIRFNGTTFTGTPTDSLGTVFSVRLVATDNHGASSETIFEVGVFPPVGSSPVVTDGGAAGGDRLGYSTAISGDGRWAVYGMPGENNGNGAVQIFENVAGTWTLRQTIATGMAAGSRFGLSVSLDYDGNRLVVGAPLENGQRGAIYYYERATTTFAAASNVKAVGGQIGERLGTSVAVNEAGNNVLAGAPLNDNARGTNAGAAYWFGWNGTAASQTRLASLDAGETSAAGDMFGTSVAFNENMQVVGAARDDHSGAVDAGSVYVFTTDNGSFSKIFKAGTIRDADYFGASVSVDSFAGRNSVLLAVGAAGDDTVGTNAGAVYIYRSDTMSADVGNGGGLDSLVYQATVFAYDAQPFQSFGTAVSIDVEGDVAGNGIRLAVGGDINASNTGAVYAYRFWDGYGWVGQRYQSGIASSPEGNQFGFSVAMAGKNIVAGAPNAERGGAFAAGSVNAIALAASEIEISPLSDAGLVKTLYSGGYTGTPSADDVQQQVRADLLAMAGVETPNKRNQVGAELPKSQPFVSDSTSFDEKPVTDDHFDRLLFDLLTLNPLNDAARENGAPTSCDAEQQACDTPTPGAQDKAQEKAQAPKGDKVTASGFGAQLESIQGSRDEAVDSLIDRLAGLVA